MPSVLSLIHRRSGSGKEQKKGTGIRLSGTTENTLTNNRPDEQLGPVNGREGNDHLYPDNPRGLGVVHRGYQRDQSIANSHLNEGPPPGVIPYMYNKRIGGTVGKSMEGNPDGIDSPWLPGASRAGGKGDLMFIPHTSLVRPAGKAKVMHRTIDDAAQIPAIYVADPTRR